MALLDIFRKKKKVEEKKKEKKVKKIAKKIVEKPKVKPVKKTKAPVKAKIPVRPKKISGVAPRVLEKPHVTEKATDLTKNNQYVFKVFPRSNKKEITKAIEDLYGVDVVSVKIVNIPRKARRLGRVEGWRKGYKKAIIKVKEGQKIEVLPK